MFLSDRPSGAWWWPAALAHSRQAPTRCVRHVPEAAPPAHHRSSWTRASPQVRVLQIQHSTEQVQVELQWTDCRDGLFETVESSFRHVSRQHCTNCINVRLSCTR